MSRWEWHIPTTEMVWINTRKCSLSLTTAAVPWSTINCRTSQDATEGGKDILIEVLIRINMKWFKNCKLGSSKYLQRLEYFPSFLDLNIFLPDLNALHKCGWCSKEILGCSCLSLNYLLVCHNVNKLYTSCNDPCKLFTMLTANTTESKITLFKQKHTSTHYDMSKLPFQKYNRLVSAAWELKYDFVSSESWQHFTYCSLYYTFAMFLLCTFSIDDSSYLIHKSNAFSSRGTSNLSTEFSGSLFSRYSPFKLHTRDSTTYIQLVINDHNTTTKLSKDTACGRSWHHSCWLRSVLWWHLVTKYIL